MKQSTMKINYRNTIWFYAITQFCALHLTASSDPVYCNPLNLDYQVQRPNETKDPLIKNALWVREGADPSIALFNNKYYLFSSKNDRYWVSDNLVHWRSLKPSSSTVLPGLRSYAPTVVVIGDTFYFKDGNGNGAVYGTQTPDNPDSWKQVSPQGWRKPDAQFFLDDDGTLWIAYGCAPDGKLYLQEVDIDTFMPKGESHVFFMPDAKNRGWEGAKHKARGMEHGDGHGWIEGAQLLKHNGIYYLVYSLPDLGNTYANGVYTANNILGPYTYQQHNPITQKLTGFSPGSGHGEIVKDRYGNWWTFTCQCVWTFDRFERRIGMFPTSIDDAGILLSDTWLTDYPTIVPQKKRETIESLRNNMNLLSINRPVKASSTADNKHPAQAAVDEEIQTFWAAKTGDSGEWFEIDLQTICKVEAVQANFGEFELQTGVEPNAAIRYQVLGSKDGKKWIPIIEKNNNEDDYPHDFTIAPKPVDARYVRIVNAYMPYGGKFALRDLRIFGQGLGTRPSKPNFSVERLKDRRKMKVEWQAVEGADGYVVRYGQEKDRLYLANQFYKTNSVQISCLEKKKEYFVTVDAFNQSGYTKGTSIAPVIAQKSHPRFYESENGHLAGGAQASGKFVGNMHTKGASCTLTVDGGSGGSFDMNVLYATALDNAFFKLDVNEHAQKLACPNTGSWSSSKKIKQVIQLQPGLNKIAFIGQGFGINLDSIELSKKDKI
jgi:hypothetical protein